MTVASKKITVPQFDIAAHYNAMVELDRDVHDNTELASSEVDLVLEILRGVPKTLFLPCFGTGRHIPHFLNAGVQKIVGVDLSPVCVAKAKTLYGDDSRVELIEADLITWQSPIKFDAAILLGNSFADCINPLQLAKLTKAMIAPLKRMSPFVMDYIGQNYLANCRARQLSIWTAQFEGREVLDIRIPRYTNRSKIMTIDVLCVDNKNVSIPVWQGSYQKLVLSNLEVIGLFQNAGVKMQIAGKASELNTYVASRASSFGMISKANWWLGVNHMR